MQRAAPDEVRNHGNLFTTDYERHHRARGNQYRAQRLMRSASTLSLEHLSPRQPTVLPAAVMPQNRTYTDVGEEQVRVPSRQHVGCIPVLLQWAPP